MKVFFEEIKEAIQVINYVPVNEIKEEKFFTFSGMGLVRRLHQLQLKVKESLSFISVSIPFFRLITQKNFDFEIWFCCMFFGRIKDRSIQNQLLELFYYVSE